MFMWPWGGKELTRRWLLTPQGSHCKLQFLHSSIRQPQALLIPDDKLRRTAVGHCYHLSATKSAWAICASNISGCGRGYAKNAVYVTTRQGASNLFQTMTDAIESQVLLSLIQESFVPACDLILDHKILCIQISILTRLTSKHLVHVHSSSSRLYWSVARASSAMNSGLNWQPMIWNVAKNS